MEVSRKLPPGEESAPLFFGVIAPPQLVSIDGSKDTLFTSTVAEILSKKLNIDPKKIQVVNGIGWSLAAEMNFVAEEERKARGQNN